VKFIPLIWSILCYRKTRTALTLASVAIAFLLFGMLQGVNTGFTNVVQDSRINRLLVANSISLTEPLPYSYLAQLEAVPGVDKVAYQTWFAAYYQDPNNEVPTFPLDPQRQFTVFPEEKLPPEQIEAMRRDRLGAIIGRSMATKYHWKVGDRVTLHAEYWVKRDGSSDWDFDIVGIYDTPTDHSDEDSLYFNHDYFDEARAYRNGTVGWYVVTIKDPARIVPIAAAIDKLFANSADETKTQTEKEFRQAYMKQVGDINKIVMYILVAVFFSLLFATAVTMLRAVRERVLELAVLKTVGFTDAGASALVLAESSVLCLLAAGIGLTLAYLLFPMVRDALGVVDMPAFVILEGLGVAALLAIVTGAVPAWRARQLVIAEALRT
jgi:putative ABC transport system permease protein